MLFRSANVNSIILNNKIENFDDLKKEESKNFISENKGVSSNYIDTNTVEACIMSKEDLKTEEKLEVAAASTAEAPKVVTPEAEATVAEPVALQQVKAELSEKNTIITELTEKLAKSEEASAKELERQVAEIQEKLEEAEALTRKMRAEMDEDKKKLAEMKKKEVKAKRTASLLECGFDESDLEESLAAYDALNDDAFDAVVAVYKKKMAKHTPEHKEDKDAEAGMPPALKEALDKKKKKEDETKAENEEFDSAEEILEEVEETEALDLTVGSENEAAEENVTKAALIDYVYSRLGKKLNKGE